MRKHLLTTIIAMTATAAMAQTEQAKPDIQPAHRPQQVMTAGDERLTIVTYTGKKKIKEPWWTNPDLRPDVFETSADSVVFESATDRLGFKVEKGGTYNFVVLKNGKDSCYTQIKWVSDNPLEEPPASITKLAPSGMLSRSQAQFDIDALIYHINEIHPDMFAVCPMGILMSKVDSVKRALPDSVSRADLFMATAPIVAMIGDGHTNLNIRFKDVFSDSTLRLPMRLSVNNETYGLTVTSCIDGLIPEGAEVTAINGISSKQMLKKMAEYQSGERYFFRLSRVNSCFHPLFHLLYGADSYVVEYREEGGKKVKTVRLEAATTSEIKKRTPVTEAVHNNDWQPYTFRIIEDKNTAVMEFNSFTDSKSMKTFADSMFTTLRDKGIGNLIIDIRNNGGGDSRVGDIILKYISPQPFVQFHKSIVRITPTTKRIGGMNSSPSITFNNGDNITMQQPLTAEEGHFNGNVYLLISHHTFSSASSFAWAFKEFGMGTVIGAESGGMNVCFGDILGYKMPVSGLSCTISFKRFWLYNADERDIHGVIPHITVPQKEALDKALNVISKKKKKTF